MNINRRNFLINSLLFGGASATAYAFSGRVSLEKPVSSNIIHSRNAGYQNTVHNRRYYSSSRF